MGIEPFLIASTINVAIGQRLVRKLCKDCVKKNPISTIEKATLKSFVSPKELTKMRFSYEPQGCKTCNQTGYVGRVGIYEVLEMSENVKHLIMKRENSAQIQKVALAEGMTTMIADGIKKAAIGITSFAEVIRVIHE